MLGDPTLAQRPQAPRGPRAARPPAPPRPARATASATAARSASRRRCRRARPPSCRRAPPAAVPAGMRHLAARPVTRRPSDSTMSARRSRAPATCAGEQLASARRRRAAPRGAFHCSARVATSSQSAAPTRPATGSAPRSRSSASRLRSSSSAPRLADLEPSDEPSPAGPTRRDPQRHRVRYLGSASCTVAGLIIDSSVRGSSDATAQARSSVSCSVSALLERLREEVASRTRPARAGSRGRPPTAHPRQPPRRGPRPARARAAMPYSCAEISRWSSRVMPGPAPWRISRDSEASGSKGGDDPPRVQLRAEHELALGDVAGDVGDRMRDVAGGHRQHRQLRDANPRPP